MGIVSLAILAFVSSSQERREEVSRPLVRLMTEKRYFAAARCNGRRHTGARGRERLRPDERPDRAAVLPADGPSGIASRDHGSRQEDRDRGRRQPLPTARNVEPGRVPQTCRERAPGLLPELRLLPRRQPGRQRHVRARAGPDPDQLRRRRYDRESSRDVSVLASRQGRPGAAGRRRPLGLGHAGLGEAPEGRRESGMPSSFSTISRARGLAPGRSTRNDRSPASRACARCPVRLVLCAWTLGPTEIGARAGSRHRDRGAARVGQEPVSQILLAVPRRQRGRRRLRHAASLPQAPQLHDGQVQGSHDAQRSAPDAPGSRQHHQARHALHLDARLAQPVRPGSVGSRLLHYDLLPRLRERRECPEARRAPERAGATTSVHRAREEALRGDRLRQVPRHARSWRRTFGSNAGGRLGATDTRGEPHAELDLPGRVDARGYLPDDDHGAQRHADAVVRRRPAARATMGDHGLHRFSLGQRRARLYQPRRRQARPRSDRSGEGGRELRVRSCRPLSDHRTNHGAWARSSILPRLP